MMDTLRSAVAALCGLAVLSTVLDALLPDGSVKNYFGFAFSLAVLLTLLTPALAIVRAAMGMGE